MTCCERCTPDRLCLNHAAEAKSRAFVRDRDEREAMVRGNKRRLAVLADACIPTEGR
jgi:hypothetical protein